jgi:hypothetical protein
MTDKIEVNGLDILDWDKKIYRIFTIERFKEVITSKKLALVHPSKWDDPFENFFLKANAIDENGDLISLEDVSKDWYGQCWTKYKDSDAMWRIYSPNKDGVRVSTTIRKLFNAVYDRSDKDARRKYFIGEVQYKEREEIEDFLNNTSFIDISFGGKSDNFARILCIKRLEFQHENEVRILINDNNSIGSDRVLLLDFDYASVFEDVALDPRFESTSFDSAKKLLTDAGCRLPISQSQLYKIDLKPIRLT